MLRGFKATAVAAAAVAAMAVLPSAASAKDALSLYHPNVLERSFTTGIGSFGQETRRGGLCIPVLLCPTIENTFVPSGGTGGASDGFLRTSVGPLLGVAGETRAIWTSSPFTYRGAEGQKPTLVGISVTRQSSLGALLSVVGNEADFSVDVINAQGVSQRYIERVPLAPTKGWTKGAAVIIGPNELIMGRQYQLRIVTRLTYGAEVLQGGDADYDDLVLIALREEDEDGGGGNGDNRPGGGSAIFDGRKLFIKLRCFGVHNNNGKCSSRATALKMKHGTRYTFPIQRIVAAKKGKIIRARVRFRFREELERRNSIILKSVLKEDRDDDDKEIKYKKLKLIDRSPD